MFDDVLQKVPPGDLPLYRSLIDQALRLGYKAKKDGTKTPSYSFRSNRYRQTVLRVIDNGKRTYLRVKFYGVTTYSDNVERALKRTIEESQFRYTGCYGCGRCVSPEGYTISYRDGREYFRCGSELIEFFDLTPELAHEIEQLMESQTRYWESRLESQAPGVPPPP